MGTDTFGRHTRACVDEAVHNAFVSLRHSLVRTRFFDRLLRAAWQRSDLMVLPPDHRGEVAQTIVLRNLSRWHSELVREPEDWMGATGHPLVVVGSLANHLFGRYPTPRFLASAWFGSSEPSRLARRRWFIEHARGKRFRSLALPMVMTRHMEHAFLRTPDHFTIDLALRRAEVLGLGGSPELAEALLATRLVDSFDEPERWRVALRWLVGRGEELELAQLPSVVDFLRAKLVDVDLRGRTFASVMRLVGAWHASLGKQRAKVMRWNASRWSALTELVPSAHDEPRSAVWSIVELLDSGELQAEGREMRHCVVSYARDCAAGRASIWSLRHRWEDQEPARSVLTIQIHPWSRTIVQVRGRMNARACGLPLALVQQWANREHLRIARWV